MENYIAGSSNDTLVIGTDSTTDLMDDTLFAERLLLFYEQSLSEMRAFARREGRPYEEIKKRVAQLHCQSLFKSGDAEDQANHILKSISQQLEYLQTICGLQSFYLAVNPGDPSDQGFLGGTLLGREFWRGYRGCGEPGARAFRDYCTNAAATPAAVPWASTSARAPTPTPAAASGVHPAGGAALRKSPANALKAEVYLAVRTAVRAASGVRTAEMKWSNHANLAAYGVELRGWPRGVPVRNPSLLSAAQNQAVLDALQSGAMVFRRIGQGDGPAPDTARVPTGDDAEVDALFEDTIDFDASSGDDTGELGKRKREE